MRAGVDLTAKLKWVRSFVEYARYCLDPGPEVVGTQFPSQESADKAMREIDIVIRALSDAEGK